MFVALCTYLLYAHVMGCAYSSQSFWFFEISWCSGVKFVRMERLICPIILWGYAIAVRRSPPNMSPNIAKSLLVNRAFDCFDVERYGIQDHSELQKCIFQLHRKYFSGWKRSYELRVSVGHDDLVLTTDRRTIERFEIVAGNNLKVTACKWQLQMSSQLCFDPISCTCNPAAPIYVDIVTPLAKDVYQDFWPHISFVPRKSFFSWIYIFCVLQGSLQTLGGVRDSKESFKVLAVPRPGQI